VLDYISNFFYDPWTFWGVPLLFAFAWEGYRRLGEGLRRRSLGANVGEGKCARSDA